MHVPTNARCRDCGYALRGLADPRCPECGRGFDPGDPATVRLPGDRLVWLPALATLAFLAWVVAASVAVAVLIGVTHAADPRTGRLPAVAVAGAWVGSFARRAVRGVPGELSPRRRRRAWAALFALALLVGGPTSAVDRSCPHGTIWGALGLGLARSETGGPCANYLYTLRSAHVAGPWYLWWA